MHLAQLNIAELRFPVTDPRLADFVGNLDRVNALAERTEGFVWRLKDDTGNATGIESPWSDDHIVNLSVWRSVEQLEQFVWNTVHKRVYGRKKEWFRPMQTNHFVMWWIDEGHMPDLEEARQRLEHLDGHGDTDHAFTWSHLPHVKLWQQQRCG